MKGLCGHEVEDGFSAINSYDQGENVRIFYASGGVGIGSALLQKGSGEVLSMSNEQYPLVCKGCIYLKASGDYQPIGDDPNTQSQKGGAHTMSITEKAPSGALYRLTAYVPASLHTKVKRAAQQADVSIGAWIRQALAEALAELAETEEVERGGR